MKKQILFAALAIGLASCSQNEMPQVENEARVAMQVSANIEGMATRAAETTWDDNDGIGVYVTTPTSGYDAFKNTKYTYSGGAFSATAPIYFQSAEDVTCSAYYPHSTDVSTQNTIAVNTSNQAEKKNFDYLFASGATATKANPNLSFTFAHKMTRLVLTIKKGDGFENLNGLSCMLSGLKLEGTFNVLTGVAAATGNASDLTLETSESDGNLLADIILLPQSATINFKATIDGKTYAVNLTPALAAGSKYSYTITVNKTGLVVSNATINAWTAVNGEDATAVID